MKSKVKMIAILSIFSILLIGCSSIDGVYKGSAGTTTLYLKKDGSLIYTEVKSKGSIDSEGTWERSKENMVIQIEEISDGEALEATIDDEHIIHIPDQPGWIGELYTKE